MQRDQIGGLLPAIFQQTLTPGGVLAAMLAAMEGLHEASEEQLSCVEDLFHPYRCPDRMVPFLSRWVAVDHLGAQRDLVAGGASLAQSRGTRVGLRDAIRLATGVSEVEIVEPADRPFHFVVRVPADCVHTEQIRQLVELEKPAATTFEMGVMS